MCKEKLITGIKVTQQMSKARIILNSQVCSKFEKGRVSSAPNLKML